MIIVQRIRNEKRYLLSWIENDEFIASSSFELWQSPVEDGHMKVFQPLRAAIRQEFPSARFGTGFGFPAINLSDTDAVKLNMLAE